MQSLNKFAPHALAILRIVTALLFIEHGTSKLLGFPAMPGAGSAGDSLPPLILIAALLEVIGGLAILVGFFTRPVAFILSGLMAVAYWMAHVPKGGFFPLTNGGDAAVLFCFIFLYLVFAGAGAWSIDARMGSIQPTQ
jgi:putative oxidoreductase